VDGFVSLHTPQTGGEVITRPIQFDGGNLTISASTSAAGGIWVEIWDPASDPPSSHLAHPGKDDLYA
jgi:hypothetical protein